MLIKIFVSSLFTEMATERDVLHRQVSAILADRLGDTGISLDFVDFRWGIDDSQIADGDEKSAFIIQKCFEAIDDCDIFLAIVGRDYGSLAPQEICREFLPDLDENRDYSFTEMELEYAKRQLPGERILFLHTPLSADDTPQIQRIKADFCGSYAHAAYQKDGSSVSPSFISGAAALISGAIGHIGSLSPRKQAFFPRTRLLEECRAAMARDNMFLLQGISGSGKSVLLRLLAESLLQDPDVEVFSVFHADGMHKSIRDILCQLFGLTGSYKDVLKQLTQKILSAPKKIVFILDDVDPYNIGDVYTLYEALVRLPAGSFSLFLSSARESCHAYFRDLQVTPIPVGDLSPEEVRLFLSFISGRYNKQFYPEVIDYIAQKGSLYANPLYLSMLMQRLITLDSGKYQQARSHGTYTQGIVLEMKKVIDSCPAKLEEIIAWNLRDMDRYVQPKFSTFLFTAMSVYNKPLPLVTVKRLYEEMFSTPWSELDYYTYRFYLREFCDTEYGCLTFKHDIIQKLARELIAENDRNEAYYRGYLTVLEEPACKDPVMTCYFAILLSDDRWLDAISSPFQQNQVFSAILELVRSELHGNMEPVTERLMGRLLQAGCQQEAVRLFTTMLYSVPLDGCLEAAYTLYRRVDALLARESLSKELQLTLLAVFLDFANAVGLEDRFTDLPDRFIRLVHSMDPEEIGRHTELLLGAARMATVLSTATDRDREYQTLLQMCTHFLELCPTLSVYAPGVIEFLTPKHTDEAKRICLKLVERYEGSIRGHQMRMTMGNLYYRLHTIFLMEKDIEKSDRYALRCYEVFSALENIDRLNSQELYDYSLGLSAYGFHCSVNHLEQEEGEVYEKLYSLRNHIVKTEPDNFTVLSALSNTVLSILLRSIPVKTSIETMLNTLTEHMFRFALRGNPRVGWMFPHFFKSVISNCNDKTILYLMLERFKDFDNMLCPVIAQNRLNSQYLLELVHVYLDIYSSYCQEEILPLEDGQRLLARLAEAGRAAVTADPCEYTYNTYYRIYLEMLAIFLRQTDSVMYMQTDIYREHKQFMESCKSLPSSRELSLFLTLVPATELFTGIYTYLDMQKQDQQFRMIMQYLMESMELDIFKEVQTDLLRIFEAVRDIPDCSHECLNYLNLGLHFLLKYLPSAKQDPALLQILEYLQNNPSLNNPS